MKIEMGESLFYSWLRHVKECQVVQTNWKVSPQWTLENEVDLQRLMEAAHNHFELKHGYKIFKKNSSLHQILQQGECDAVGICVKNCENRVYAVDVAFHEGGLNYGARDVTVMKVIAKTVRTAMCLWGYMGNKNADIIFASPKITPAVLKDTEQCVLELNDIFKQQGFEFNARIIANEDFNSCVLQPILLISDGVADTSELFLRSYQMFNMFTDRSGNAEPISNADEEKEGAYAELKIGQLVQTVFRRLLERGAADEDEVKLMQQRDYSKQNFDLQYPVLVKADMDYDRARYYREPLLIRQEKYLLCSQWFETSSNNDRPYLLKWLEEHSKL